MLSILVRVLNAGYVELVDSMGGDNGILEAARICFQTENSGNFHANEILIKSLVRKKHTSPFEHCVMRFKVKLPLFVRDQWVRHRIGMSYNIKSLRYCEAKPEFFIPDCLIANEHAYNVWVNEQSKAFGEYKTWITHFQKLGLKRNRARELARTKLPTSIYTEMIVTMNAASLMHFLDLRNHKHAQPEIQAYAEALLDCAKVVAPKTFHCYANEIAAKQSVFDDSSSPKELQTLTNNKPGYEDLTLF
jgi:thymidylate synthase (FAD)